MPRPAILPALTFAVLAGCAGEGAPPAEAPLAVSTAEFAQLRWLEGSWRGSGGGVDAFFEGYRWVDDSTIRKFGFPDSTLATPSDSGDIALRGGTVRSGGPEREYVLVALDSSSVRFAPGRGAANGFEWRRTGESSWTARLTWDSAGVARERTYEMQRYSPAPTGGAARP